MKRTKNTSGKRTAAASRPLLIYLQGILASLNPTERLIAEYILKDPEKVLYHTISQMREYSGASVGSIVGFCRSLGARGFADLKIALARELAQGGLSTSDQALDPKMASVFDQVFQFHAKSLAETRMINTEETMLRASHALERARRIQFFSTGLSYAVAFTAYCKFRLIGLPAFTESDSHMQLVCATQLGKGDVAFGISCSGRTQETVQCLELAHAQRATTICLTNSMRSPITAHADVVLHATPSEIKYFQAPAASRVTQLAVMDALFVSIALRRKSQSTRYLHRIGSELMKHRLS
jgi:RpiR family transcriptional regulator, carbohydrate utilization regulator